MHMLFSIAFALIALSTAQAGLVTQVHSIDFAAKPNEENLIFLGNGQVAKLSSDDSIRLKELEDIRQEKSWIDIDLNSKREVIHFERMNISPEPRVESFAFQSFQNFNPTVIDSMKTARSIFNDARYDPKESQCYNRAHIWAYEWRMNYKLLTSKIWLFFTRKYIRKYDFEWWFHVAPLFHVNIDNRMMERVADVKYARAPLRMKQWTDIFLRNDAECPLVQNYSDGANYPESRWCYTMKTSMYYYQPVDLEEFEKYGTERTSWVEEDIRNAYLEAFGISL
jgi:hypothetical protein